MFLQKNLEIFLNSIKKHLNKNKIKCRKKMGKANFVPD